MSHTTKRSFHKTLSSDLDIKIIYPGKVLAIKKGKPLNKKGLRQLITVQNME